LRISDHVRGRFNMAGRRKRRAKERKKGSREYVWSAFNQNIRDLQELQELHLNRKGVVDSWIEKDQNKSILQIVYQGATSYESELEPTAEI
jgi:hypothetical protein